MCLLVASEHDRMYVFAKACKGKRHKEAGIARKAILKKYIGDC